MDAHKEVIHPKDILARQKKYRNNRVVRTVSNFNERLALHITTIVGTMACAYTFVVLTLPALPQVVNDVHHGIYISGVSWITQTFIQLVLLPIIIVGQNIMQKQNNAKADADHRTLTYLANLQDEQMSILRKMSGIEEKEDQIIEGQNNG